jgi:hypothetical protein
MFVDSVKHLEDDLLDVVETMQAPLVTGAASVAEAFADWVPARPEWPFVSELPTVTEVVELGAQFATRLVNQQAEFARRLVHAFDPILTRIDERAATKTPPSRTKASEPKAA